MLCSPGRSAGANRSADGRYRGQLGGKSEPVALLEAQDIRYGHAVHARGDPPGRQNLCSNELVDRFAIELPPDAELPYA